MELKDLIQIELDNSKRGILKAMDTLTQQEIAWRSCSGCNSIGLIAYHVARFEDSVIQTRVQGKAQIWESEKWYQKLSLPLEDIGAHYTVEQVNAFIVPANVDIKAYADSVRAKTIEYLNGVSPDELNRKITMRMGDMPIGSVFALLVGHTFQHIGEMSYLRGMQRGMDK